MIKIKVALIYPKWYIQYKKLQIYHNLICAWEKTCRWQYDVWFQQNYT